MPGNANQKLKTVDKFYLSTWNTLAIFPMARILLRITSLRAAIAPPNHISTDYNTNTYRHFLHTF